ncbi:uncharacterized protein BJ212DRAFT_1474777 [Suillus subaureus]|uniref:Uncharacterized protein n=1 Tax=Suillus subaureus TaxID=48587 RepID=A0A9P7JKR9_9AGAM|nr:uncharacterized protein BJ212DRAFT_1474777 [Suillus subaureus]KAG1827622.1 hypothetical protein BJ212DRAFT_1474777 [Suillus subaureus]
MPPPDKRMVLNKEHVIPATTISPSSLQTFNAIVDHIAIVATQSGDAGSQASDPSNHVAQAVSKMQKVLRGALINGRDWIFLLMTLNDDYAEPPICDLMKSPW